MEFNGQKPQTNASRRVITGLVLAVVLCALWLLGGWPLRIGLVALMLLCMHEMYSAFTRRGDRPAVWVGIAYVLLALPAYLLLGREAIGPLLAAMTAIGLSAIVLRDELDFSSAMATIYPLFYPGLLMTLIFPLLDISSPLLANIAAGEAFLIALMNDLAAYEVGTRIGKHRLMPNLSPKKSWEGAVAGVAAAVVTAMLVPLAGVLICRVIPAAKAYLTEIPPLWQFALLGLVSGFLSITGDLNASLVKRWCGIKDYGSLLPGHGGMLDRLDSVLFCIVPVYVYFVWILRL